MRTKTKSQIQKTKGLTAVTCQNLDKENGVLAQAEGKNEADPHQDPKTSLPAKTQDTPENKGKAKLETGTWQPAALQTSLGYMVRPYLKKAGR